MAIVLSLDVQRFRNSLVSRPWRAAELANCEDSIAWERPFDCGFVQAKLAVIAIFNA